MASSTSFVLSEACIIILFSSALHLELIMYVVKRKKLKLEPKQPAEANKKSDPVALLHQAKHEAAK